MNPDYNGLYTYLIDYMQNNIDLKEVINMNNAEHVYDVLTLSLPVLYREMIVDYVE
jgi:hypothetical protein